MFNERTYKGKQIMSFTFVSLHVTIILAVPTNVCTFLLMAHKYMLLLLVFVLSGIDERG